MSNETCGKALPSLVSRGTAAIGLGHLSGENNTPALAMEVSQSVLEREGIRIGRDVLLHVALRDQTGELYTIRDPRADA